MWGKPFASEIGNQWQNLCYLDRPFINFMDPCVEAVEKMMEVVMEVMAEVGKVVLEAKDVG